MANEQARRLLPVREDLRFLGLRDRNAAGMAMALYAGYVLYLLLTCIWLYLRRKHYLLRKIPTGISMGAAAMQLILLTSHFCRFFFFDYLPAPLVIWRNYVVLPLFIVFSFQARGMGLLFEVLWTRSIGQASLEEREREESIEKEKEQARKGEEWWQASRRKLKDLRFRAGLRKQGAYLITVTLASIHVTLAAILHYFVIGGIWTCAPCPLLVESVGVVVMVAIYLVIWCPIMLGLLTGVKDAYGLCKDLQRGSCYAFPLYLLYIVVRNYAFLQPLRREFPAFLFMLLAVLAVHTFTVTWPLIRTLSWAPDIFDREVIESDYPEDITTPELASSCSPIQPQVLAPTAPPKPRLHPSCTSPLSIVIPQRPIPLELVLDNPELFPPFASYSKNAFVWDSVLFHRAICRFRQMAPQLSPENLFKDAHYIYNQYIIAGSPCEMNLTFKTLQQIHQAIKADTLSPDMFDDAHQEVLRLVNDCTYRNFLYTLDPATKARYMIPIGKSARK